MDSELEAATDENRRAVESFLARAGAHAGEGWWVPRAGGKWSPAQVAEHIALGYELSAQVVQGKAVVSGMPRFLRPLLRALFFKRLLRTGRFPANAKAPREFRPAERPPAADALIPRIRAAAKGFEAAVTQVAAGGAVQVDHLVFGAIGLVDYVRFVSVHTRHHERQFPPVPPTAAGPAS